MIYYRFFSKIYQVEGKKMCQACQDFIKKGSKILDLGCGSGIVGKVFEDFFQAKLIGVDIEDKRVSPISFQLIDGKLLPFPKNSFDVVLINYVLHHSQDPIALLKEAKRVAKDKIIIFEDLPEDFLSKLICQFHAFSSDNLFGNPPKTFFELEKDWEEIFRNLKLNIIFKERIKDFPIKKELFILDNTYKGGSHPDLSE